MTFHTLLKVMRVSTFLTAFLRHALPIKLIIAGMLAAMGFAPFHLPGMAFLSLAFFFYTLQITPPKSRINNGFFLGLCYGLGFFGLSVSWVFFSIHEYGHLHWLCAGCFTLLFVAYLALFPATMAVLFQRFCNRCHVFYSALLFSLLWTLSEWARAHLFGGFSWVLLGTAQVDTPLGLFLPFIGVYGVGFIAAMVACMVVCAFQRQGLTRAAALFFLVGALLLPLALPSLPFIHLDKKPLKIAVIQANLSMRDKWDEQLFWKILDYYHNKIIELLPRSEIIILPESAIPIPKHYVTDWLENIQHAAEEHHAAVLLGIPTEDATGHYYNAAISLGQAQGNYHKRHLVPFGEYIPRPFAKLMKWLDIPIVNMASGKNVQPLITLQQHPIATLICYEIAYPNLMRHALRHAEFIVSMSDDGWFGRSFAAYQQLQIAQALSLTTGRYQIVSNNDGLSAIIAPNGHIQSALPAFREGILKGTLYTAHGLTLWAQLGDWPFILGFTISLLLLISIPKLKRATCAREQYTAG